MTTANSRQCLRMCWLYQDCTIVTYFPHKFLCRLTTDSPANLATVLVYNDKAVTVDLREATIDKPRLHGCDHRNCLSKELCVPLVDPDTYRCLPLGYDKCPSPPPSVPNSVNTMDGISKIVYDCNDGYVKAGTNDVTTCDQATGQWSSIDVTCTFTDCGTPPPLEGASTLGDDTFYGAKVLYTCYDGYVSLSPSMEITCQANNQWKASPSSCERVTCLEPTYVINGTVRVLDRVFVNLSPGVDTQELAMSYGAMVVHSCNEGFQAHTTEFRSKCQADGKWESTSSFICNPVNCGRPPAFPNTWSSFNSTTFHEKVAYRCVEGYENVTGASMELTCAANGTWSGPDVACNIVDCGTPPEEKNTTALYSTTTYLSEAMYSCNAPTIMYQQDVQSRRCQADGEWSDEEIPCIPCGNPQEITNGTFIITRKTPTLYAAEYSCDYGFKITRRDPYKACQRGSWIGDPVECVPISCGEFPVVSNATVQSNGTTLHSMAIYSCDEGYAPVKNKTTNMLTCGENGWMDDNKSNTFNLLECPKIACGPPPQIDNTFSEITNNISNPNIEVVTYRCKTGYMLASASNAKRCLPGGWENTTVTCKTMECGTPKTLPNTTWVLNISETDTRAVMYTCLDGYNKDQYVVECVDGNWTNYDAVSCQKLNCGSPPTVENATTTVNGTLYNDAALYDCKSGTNWTITCQSDGIWSEMDNKTCDVRDCGPPLMFSNAIPSYNGSKEFDKVKYTCAVGYRLTTSSSEVVCIRKEWFGEIATLNKICEVIDCQIPPPVTGAIANYTTTTFNSTLIYECTSNSYIPSGNPVKTCNESSMWSGDENFKCSFSQCGAPPRVSNSSVDISEDIKEGDVISYSCNPGFEFAENKSEKTCLPNTNRWSDDKIECLQLACGHVPIVDNAKYLLRFFNDILAVVYMCDPGYKATTDNDAIACLGGQWRYANFIQCFPEYCSDPPHVEHASFNLTNKDIGAVTTYTCNLGYQHWWFDSKTCTEEGTWSEERVECNVIDCQEPPHIPHTHKSFNGTIYGSSVYYTCEDDYVFTLESTKICTEDGLWSDDLVECSLGVVSNCPMPPNEPFSKMFLNTLVPTLFTNVAVVPTATYICDYGYTRYVNSFTKKCHASEWESTGIKAVCSLEKCPDPPIVDGASMSYEDILYGSVVQYTCNHGNTMAGPGSKTCQADGTWSHDTTECFQSNRVFCPEPPKVENAEVRVSTYDGKAFYNCLPGYTGGGRIHCDQDGDQWSTTTSITCTPVECFAPRNVSEASVTVYKTTFGNRAVYECNAEYRQTGPYISVCNASEQWSEILRSPCEAILQTTTPGPTCPMPIPNITNALGQLDDAGDIIRVVYSCNPGYEVKFSPIDSYQITCLHNGTWSDYSKFSCEPAGECGNIPAIRNAARVKFYETISDAASGEVSFVASYKCNRGYVKNGTQRWTPVTSIDITCSTNIGWSDLPQCDIVSCGTPPENASETAMLRQINGTTYESQATYVCGPPSMGDQKVSVCQETGNWSQVDMVCREAYCDVPIDIHGGKLVPVQINRQFSNSSWSVECHDNFVYLADANETVTCSLIGGTFKEHWADNYTLTSCVRNKWFNITELNVELPYNRRKDFNTISICVAGHLNKQVGTKASVLFIWSNGVDRYPLRAYIQPEGQVYRTQYRLKNSGHYVNTYMVVSSLVWGQYITLCTSFFLANSTFTATLDGRFHGEVHFPIAGDIESENFELDWARNFTVKRNIHLKYVNITYTTLQ